jgi:hypothetical protein
MDNLEQEVRDLAYQNYKMSKQMQSMSEVVMNLCRMLEIEVDPSKGLPVNELFQKISELSKDEPSED